MAKWITGLRRWWSPLVFILLLAAVLQGAYANPPVFENAPYVRTLSETTNTAKTLVTSFSCSDADGPQATVVSLKTPGGVTPTSPCGTCFSVFPTNPGVAGTDYYLLFQPVQTLNYNTASNYYVTVQCTDGNQTVDQVVDIRLVKNTPPTFNPNSYVVATAINKTKTQTSGYAVYDVNAIDADSDTIIYTMTTDPASSNFEIGAGDGIIRAKNDLMVECSNFITFKVNISDGRNPPVGPLSIQTTINGPNVAPDVTNMDTTIQVREDTAVGAVIRPMVVTDDDNKNLVYTLTAYPPENLAYFNITGSGTNKPEIVVKSALDYENSIARKTNLTIVANDGYCTSPTHYLTVTVTDANEPPDIQPENAAYSVYEGSDLSTQLSISWSITDPDFTDTHTFTIIGGNTNNLFRIDPSSGQLSVNGDYDIDNLAMPLNQTLLVKVTDKGGLSDNTTVVLNFKDRNDNYPVIATGDYAMSVCENRRVGAVIGNAMTCTDRDSPFQGNNQTYFTGGSSQIFVASNGEIIMTVVPVAGQTFTTTAYCSDRGQWPGPLTSAVQIISVTGTACTTNAVTRVPATTAAPTTTTTPKPTTVTVNSTTPASTANSKDWVDENLPWIIIAALLATALLGLLAYMLWVYCRRYCCRDPCCPKRPPRPRRLPKPVTPPKKITPVEEPPPPPPTPPPAVVGDPNGNLYDFWKERYPDDDYGKQPNRNLNPRPVTPTGGFFSQNAGLGQNAPSAASAPKKFCTIL